MYESLGSQFFRTITRIQSGPGFFGKSRLVMAFLTKLRVNEYYSVRLIVEGTTVKEISKSSKFELLKRFLAKNVTLPEADTFLLLA